MRVHEIGDEAKMNVKSELAKNISRGQRYFVNALWAYREVIDSIRKRGVNFTIQVIVSELGSWWFDIRYGTSTVGWAHLDDLEIESENKWRGVRYEPTRPRPFRALMNSLDFPDGSVFVDWGSGKGRVLLMASEHGFKKVVGVEFSHELCEAARRNVSIYREKRGIDVDVEIHECDVVDYEVKDDENVFYVFQPFDAVVMDRVLSNINKSLEQKLRKIYLIYNSPIWRDLIEGQRRFAILGEYTLTGSKFVVYVSNDWEDRVRE